MSYCWPSGEPVVAVGPKDIVETVNTEAAVYDKTTHAQLALYHFESFWTGGTNEQCVDPRAIYLPGDDRFAISCTDITNNGTGPVRFAISASGDPTGAWYKYVVPNTTFLDQDKIEATSDQFIVAGNNLDGIHEDIYVYNKSDVLSGVANPAVVQVATTHSNLYQAAVEQTYASNGYLVATYPGSDVWLATVGGTPAAGNVHLSETDLGANNASAPVEPTVPGGKIGNGDLDGRIYNAVYEAETSDNKPVIQFSTADQCGSPAADCVLSARIDLSGSTPVLKYEQSFGQAGWDYTYGAAGLNAAGQVFEAYSRSNSSNAPGAAVLGPGFDVTLQPAQPGSSSCGSTATPPCDERWGDYLSTAIDPSDPSSVWVSGLYQLTNGPYGSGVLAWGTIIQKVTADSNFTVIPVDASWALIGNSGNEEVFRITAGVLWQKWLTRGGTTWSGWLSLGAPPGRHLVGNPRAWDDPVTGNEEVYARDSSGNYSEAYYSGSNWSWFPLTTPTTPKQPLVSDPTVIKGVNNVDLFGIDSAGNLEQDFFQPGGTTWSGWNDIAGAPTGTQLVGRPFAWIDPVTHNEEVFARDSAGNYWQVFYTGANWSWVPLGAPAGMQLVGDPSVVRGLNNVDLFGIDSAGNLEQDFYPSGGPWSTWHSLNAPTGSKLVGTPSVWIDPVTQHEEVFARDSAGNYWQDFYPTGGPWSWASLGTPIQPLVSDPTILMGIHNVDLYGVDSGGNIEQAFYPPSGTSWSSWLSLGAPLPSTSVVVPSNGATMSGTTASLDATASNATSVEFLLFGGSYGYTGHVVGTATLTYYGWVYSWNTKTVANSPYVLLSEAFNSNGSAFSPGVNITVNNSPPPTTSVLVPSNGATLTGTSATLDASASNATSVEFWLFGGSYGYTGKMIGTATLTAYGWLSSWNTKTVANSSYVLLSEAFNSGGGAFSSGVSITVHN